MRHIHTLLLTLAVLALLPGAVFGQRGRLMADCIIQLKHNKDGQTRLTVMPGTTPAYVLTPTDLHFVLALLVDETYLLTFEHTGCVTKQLYIDASVPLDKRAMDFDFPLKVVLAHHDEPFTYSGPVGYIFYQHGLADFSYHTDYAININDRFAGRMAEFELTGVDPRSATLGYTASILDPQTNAPERLAPVAFWDVQAPLVAHVAPMVHRLSKTGNSLQDPAASPLQVSTIDIPLTVILPLPVRVAEPVADVEDIGRYTEVVKMADMPVVAPSTGITRGTAAIHQDFSWELIVEEHRVTTIIRLTNETDRSTEYRRVLHASGAMYFFLDGRSISEYTYEKGIDLTKQVNGAMEHEALEL
jgi:hypothetical protein